MSNDLISRSALMDRLRGNVLVDVTPELEETIEEQPTAYDVDKVVEQLESKMFSAEVYNDDMNGVQIDNLLCYGDMYEIVKAGGIERSEIMERLTEKAFECTQLVVCGNNLCEEVCEQQEGCDTCPVQKAFEKLSEYEDLEEQGLMLKLPCTVGDTVYAIEADEEKFEHFHCGLKISKLEFDFWMIPIFGKCVFLTQAETKEALRRMKEKEEKQDE